VFISLTGLSPPTESPVTSQAEGDIYIISENGTLINYTPFEDELSVDKTCSKQIVLVWTTTDHIANSW